MSNQFTRELEQDWEPGKQDEQSISRLVALVDAELQTLAKKMRRGFSPAPSLETIDLVGEMYLRLVGGKTPEITDHDHFFCIAAKTMRWILLSRHAKRKTTELEDLAEPATDSGLEQFDLEALSEALDELREAKPRLAKVIDLNYFLSIEPKAIADITRSSVRTVFRDLQTARSWLYWRLGGAGSSHPIVCAETSDE